MICKNVIDGIIITDLHHVTPFSKSAVNLLKFHDIPLIGVTQFSYPPIIRKPTDIIYWLDSDKDYAAYIETHVISSCNLNCKGCGHFSPLFNDNDFYEINSFKRDIRRISENLDLITLRLLGGEPLLKKDLADYIKIARHYLKKTTIRIVTNGLLIPSLPQNLLDTIRENDVIFDISLYSPTMKIFDKIKSILEKNEIAYNNDILYHLQRKSEIKTFVKRMLRHGTSNPGKSLAYCRTRQECRFLRAGKLYKCPMDALVYRFTENFKINDFPKSMGIDIHASNFLPLFHQLEEMPIDLCRWCLEGDYQDFEWKAPSKRVKEEWLV